MSVGAGCLAPGRSLLALFVNTAALLWLFVYILIEVTLRRARVRANPNPNPIPNPNPPNPTPIEVIWNWGLSVDACEAYGWFDLSPSPDHWMLLSFAIVGIVVVALFFMYNVFVAPPPPPRSAIDAENAKVRRGGREEICTYPSSPTTYPHPRPQTRPRPRPTPHPP
jgi:hypothetical protein